MKDLYYYSLTINVPLRHIWYMNNLYRNEKEIKATKLVEQDIDTLKVKVSLRTFKRLFSKKRLISQADVYITIYREADYNRQSIRIPFEQLLHMLGLKHQTRLTIGCAYIINKSELVNSVLEILKEINMGNFKWSRKYIQLLSKSFPSLEHYYK
jgi:hypothetical protein